MAEHTITPLARRLWWPEAYADEEMPEGRGTPSDWLYRLDDGAHRCGDRTYPAAATFAVREGTVIPFIARDDLGQAVVTIGATAADDTWSGLPPADATVWCEDGYEALGDGPADFSANLRAYNEPEIGERIVVAVARWIDHAKGIRCRFTAQGGPPRFVALDPLPEVGPALPEIVREDGGDLFASPVA